MPLPVDYRHPWAQDPVRSLNLLQFEHGSRAITVFSGSLHVDIWLVFL